VTAGTQDGLNAASGGGNEGGKDDIIYEALEAAASTRHACRGPVFGRHGAVRTQRPTNPTHFAPCKFDGVVNQSTSRTDADRLGSTKQSDAVSEVGTDAVSEH
jgi:hypothetical protein